MLLRELLENNSDTDPVPELNYNNFNKALASKISKNKYSTPRTVVSAINIKESKDFNTKEAFDKYVSQMDAAITNAIYKEAEKFVKDNKLDKETLTVVKTLHSITK